MYKPPLRQWQEQAFAAWVEADHHGIVAAVTGGGKTLLALRCVDEYRRTVPAATTVICVPTDALQEQWIDEVASYFDWPTEKVVSLTSKRKIVRSRVHVAVINTLAMLAEHPPEFPVFLVVDECHRAASPEFRRIFHIQTEATLGLSATPKRQYDAGLEEVLLPNLGPIVSEYDYRDALRDGVIVPFRLNNIAFEFSEEDQTAYDKLTRAIQASIARHGIEASETISLLLRRARISNRSLERIRICLKIVARNRKRRIIVFHEDIEACNLINEVLLANGINSAAYHSRIPSAQRLETLGKFRANDIDVLVTCRALDEGFNVPNVGIAIVAAATATYRQRIQRLGRVLRPSPGKTFAEIYTLVASAPEIRRLAEEAATLEDVIEVRWSRA